MKIASQKSYRRPEHGEGHPDYNGDDIGANDDVGADDDVGANDFVGADDDVHCH